MNTLPWKEYRRYVIDILLNLKELSVRVMEAETVEQKLIKEGEGKVTAGRYRIPAGVEIVDPDHHAYFNRRRFYKYDNEL